MKKALSLLLALVMALSLTVPALAADGDKSGTTTITATKAAPFSYEIVIPESVTGITAAGVYQVGQAKVENVVSATADTVISYTATTTDFKLSTDESKTMAATYHTEQAATNAFPTTAVKVYENKADAASIPTMWVKIADSDWNAADAGTYTATVTFNFEAKEEVEMVTVSFATSARSGATNYLFTDSSGQTVTSVQVPKGTAWSHSDQTLTIGDVTVTTNQYADGVLLNDEGTPIVMHSGTFDADATLYFIWI